MMHELTGAEMFGGPIAKWPARLADAVREVAMRRRMRDNAHMEAQHKEAMNNGR